jgi:hypothetical protein
MNRQKGIHGCGTGSLWAILTVVANSPISVAVPASPSAARLPYGYEDADITILNWIVAAGGVQRPYPFVN